MSLLPAFSIGLWNAWLLMLYFPLQPYLLLGLDRAFGNGGAMQRMGGAPDGPAEKRLNTLHTALMLLLAAYSIFLPIRVGTAWFTAGLVLYLAGLALLLAAMLAAVRTPADQLFTAGIYRYSRHPMYLAAMLLPLGIGLACASWLFLLGALALCLLMRRQAIVEERDCLAAYGDPYAAYQRSTPRWLGLPKSKTV